MTMEGIIPTLNTFTVSNIGLFKTCKDENIL